MSRVCIILFICAVVISPLTSFAWGVLGHRVIGQIAEHYLDTKTKAEIRKILGNESLPMASNWADFIKSDRKYDHISPWHYINLPPRMSRSQLDNHLRNDTSTNLYTRMRMIVAEMKKPGLTKEKKVFYLKLLIHFVGDAHQPMHTARPSDRGGNEIKLYWFNTPTNLHRVWDEQLVEFQQLSYTEHAAAINFPSASELKAWKHTRINEWIYESYQVAEKLYADIKPEERLSYSYNYRYVDVMNRQLLKGGVRLAALLNEIF